MSDRTVATLSRSLAQGEISSVELTRDYLDRIAQHNTLYNAYITVTEDLALAQAAKADAARAKGDFGPLTGIPIAHKDIFCLQDVLTTCGSKMLANFVSPYNATVVEKLNAAGTVTLGKTNMDEFAMGSSNENSFYGAVRNPWDTDRVPGGSSGGSAAAVAADLCVIATGTDTGGSIRQPAAFCGLTGFKPSYGRISRWGMVAYASSLDQAGPISKSAEDAALLMNAMAGPDHRDSTSVDIPAPDFTANLNDSLQGLRIGVVRQHLAEGLDANVEKAMQDALKVFEGLGATVKEIDLPNSHLSVSAYYVIAPAEASANLSRYDGVRFGYRCENPVNLEDMYKRSRSEGFGNEVKRRILVGTYALSAGYYDAYYIKAQQIRRLIKQDYIDAFKEVDVIIGPTTPNTAFKIGEKNEDPVTMYLEDIYTVSINLAGLPAISIPAGTTQSAEGKTLPIGIQLVGSDFAEAKVLNIAHQFQQHTDWHQQRPEG